MTRLLDDDEKLSEVDPLVPALSEITESPSAQYRRQTVSVLEQIPDEIRKIADGALDRLCDWDAATGTGEWLSTAERIADFQRAFILLSSERVAAVSRREE